MLLLKDSALLAHEKLWAAPPIGRARNDWLTLSRVFSDVTLPPIETRERDFEIRTTQPPGHEKW